MSRIIALACLSFVKYVEGSSFLKALTRAPAPAPTPAVTANVFPLPANFKKVVAALLTLLTAPPSTFISFILLPIPIGSLSKASAICAPQPCPPLASLAPPNILQISFIFLFENSINFCELLIILLADSFPKTCSKSAVRAPLARVLFICPPNGKFFCNDLAMSYCLSNTAGAP